MIHGAPRERLTLSYWVSGLASPFVTFTERIATLVEAQQSGDDAMVQQAMNAGFGELHSPGGGEVPEWAEIKEKSRTSSYARGEVPDEALYLTLDLRRAADDDPVGDPGVGTRAPRRG